MSYDAPQAANLAIKVINGKQALGKRLKVELKKGGLHLPPLGYPSSQPSSQSTLLDPAAHMNSTITATGASMFKANGSLMGGETNNDLNALIYEGLQGGGWVEVLFMLL